MERWRGRGLRRDDDGQLMLVAGIVVTIAFLMTALTLSQVASLEREAAAEKPLPISDEWRFLHDRLSANLQTAVTDDMSKDTFKNVTFPAIAATFRDVEAEKGYDAVFRLAGSGVTSKSESDLVTAGTYNAKAWTTAGVQIPGATDGVNDGILMTMTGSCPNGAAVNCIQGVYVFMHLSDGVASMDEVMLVAVDRT